jgi:Mg2+ and Co2+ transporter CorA
LAKDKIEVFLQGDHLSSTETDTEFDIVQELKGAVDDIEKAIRMSSEDDVLDKISYLKFLLGELDDALSGQFEELRLRRFITKKTS